MPSSSILVKGGLAGLQQRLRHCPVPGVSRFKCTSASDLQASQGLNVSLSSFKSRPLALTGDGACGPEEILSTTCHRGPGHSGFTVHVRTERMFIWIERKSNFITARP